jgi:hypothetical protein
MKAMIAQDCMLQYPNHNKPFHIYTDASDYQLGAEIVQEGVPVAYYSRKLTDTQQKYTTWEKELLSIFMTWKEFETMLELGPDNTIHTNHKNLTFMTAVNDCVIWQLNFVKQFSPTYVHIAGYDNFLADMYSQLSCLSDANIPVDLLPKRESTVENESKDTWPCNGAIEVNTVKNFSFPVDDPEMLECFLALPDENNLPFALNLQYIATGQHVDQAL